MTDLGPQTPAGRAANQSATSLKGKGNPTADQRRDTKHLAQNTTNYNSASAGFLHFFHDAVSPLLGSPSFRFPFPYSLFGTLRATRWGAALAES